MLVLNAVRSTIRAVGKARHDRRAALQRARARQASGWWPAEMVWLIAAFQMLSCVSKTFELARPGVSGLLKRGSRGVNFSWYKLRFR